MTDILRIIEQMTLEEKAALCTGASNWTTLAIERLGIPQLFMSDGPHGVRRVTDINELAAASLPATCFPTASSLAASWDIDLCRELGQALADEAIALQVDLLLGPGNNMKRTPLCGRNFEYFSEDPFLTGELAAAFIDGVQSRGVGTSLKHYAANNQEFQRFSISAAVDERTLREIYLPAFETAVKKARPWTVMCAYNRVNGIYCSEHHELLVDILKNEWGFEGAVISDWGAVHDRVQALKGGLDLEMPGPKPRRVAAVVAAVRAGELDEAVLDEAVRRLLQVIFKAAEKAKGGVFDQAAHHALARRAAGEGMVLLKNNGILPLQRPGKIAVIGRAAQQPHFQGGGSSFINATRVAIPLAELQSVASGAELSYCEGYPLTPDFQRALIDEAVAAAQQAEVALLFIALPTFKEAEGYDRADLDLSEHQITLIKAVSAVQPATVVILNNGSAVAMSAWIDGVAAVVEAWLMGQAGGGAIADLLFGQINPCGKLAETFPLAINDTPAFINFPGGNGEVRYGEGLFIGYRYYDFKQQPVLFAFGHGLSYTTFEYGNAQLSAPVFKDSDGITVSVDVTNTGKLAGKEIVQLYVSDRQARLVRPRKELKGFAKVALEPGESKTVTFSLEFRAFAYYHPGYQSWITDTGEVDILIGASAADIRCTLTAMLESTVVLPCRLNRESTVREWLEDPRGQAVFHPLFEQFQTQMGALFNTGEHGQGSLDILSIIMEMPLLSVLHFEEKRLPLPADDIVDGMLKKVYEG